MATLCMDQADAVQVAEFSDLDWPRHSPHMAVQLVDAADFNNLLAAAESTLAKNLHLADGENCTLIDLKRAVEKITGKPI